MRDFHLLRRRHVLLTVGHTLHHPLVQSICESGDVGEPAALDEDTVTGMAFRQLAERVVERVAYREQHMAPTQKVEITHS